MPRGQSGGIPGRKVYLTPFKATTAARACPEQADGVQLNQTGAVFEQPEGPLGSGAAWLASGVVLNGRLVVTVALVKLPLDALAAWAAKGNPIAATANPAGRMINGPIISTPHFRNPESQSINPASPDAGTVASRLA